MVNLTDSYIMIEINRIIDKRILVSQPSPLGGADVCFFLHQERVCE